MIKDILKSLFINAALLPGEMGLIALIMYRELYRLSFPHLYCLLGLCITINFLIIWHVQEKT